MLSTGKGHGHAEGAPRRSRGSEQEADIGVWSARSETPPCSPQSTEDLSNPSSKPNIAKTILQEEGMHAALDGKLVISICAGVTIAQLQSWVPASVNVVRAMPNTPCKVRIWLV